MSIYEKLYPFQKNIVDKFKDKTDFGIFLDMGLGKTPISLALAEANRCKKILIISINSKATETVDDNGSFLYWANQSCIKYKFYNKFNNTFNNEDNELFIINYESLFKRNNTTKKNTINLKSNILNFIDSCKDKKVAIIIDESHKIKDLQSKQTLSIKKIKSLLKIKADEVYTYLLTGTPFTTGYIDIYSQLKLLGLNINKAQFKDEFCIIGNVKGLLGYQQPIIGYKNINSLFNLIHKYAITIKSESVINLPDKFIIYHTLPSNFLFYVFTNEMIKGKYIINLYDKFKINKDIYYEKALKNKNIDVNNPFYRNIDYPDETWYSETVGNFWLRCRQLSIGFQGNSENSKWFDKTRLKELEKFLSENENNYVLFYNYTSELLEIYDICEKLGYNIDIYSGPIKALNNYNNFCMLSESEKLVNKKNIILSNYESGSTGKNWQEYNQCILFSLPLYKDYEQGLKRILRIGQKNTVFYHIFYQNNWLDKNMLKSLNEGVNYSQQMFDSDLGRLKNILKEDN